MLFLVYLFISRSPSIFAMGETPINPHDFVPGTAAIFAARIAKPGSLGEFASRVSILP